MATHIKVLAWLHIVFGIFGALAAAALLGLTIFGAAFAGSVSNSMIASVFGGAFSMFVGAMAALQLVAGWGLLQRKPWARILTIVLGVISLIRIPLGTLLGVYTLWVLLSKDGAAEFGVTSA